MGIIDRINSSKDIKKLGYAELTMLSDEIRDFLVDKLSKSGGHLASNLGTVELTLAINRVYDPEVDRILFDVGHQSYTHKIITGRRDLFDSLRSFNGLAGFPRPYESNADAFTAGHSSDAISVALGMAKARSLLNKVYDICVVLGDGSLSGGLAYEGLENVATLKEPMVIILNDNAMSINKNVAFFEFKHTHCGSDSSTFSGPVMSDETEDIAGFNRQVYIVSSFFSTAVSF